LVAIGAGAVKLIGEIALVRIDSSASWMFPVSHWFIIKLIITSCVCLFFCSY
jgi:hypothetical protein